VARVQMLIRWAEGRNSFRKDEMIHFMSILYYTFLTENLNEDAMQKSMEICSIALPLKYECLTAELFKNIYFERFKRSDDMQTIIKKYKLH
jgi:hypothetical protein